MPNTPLDIIRSQIDAAQTDLQQYPPSEMNWHARAKDAAGILVPWLEQHATGMKEYVEGVLNAPIQIRQIWSEIRSLVSAPIEQIEAFDRHLALDEVLGETITCELISRVVTKYMLEHNTCLKSNGSSDYPDIFLNTLDYSSLPVFNRSETNVYGAALKGPQRRPVRVPDGLEIKTCSKRIAVDCHFNHAGLHFALVFNVLNRIYQVSDLRIAFLRPSDYRISGRNTGTTTFKASFNGERFVSVIPQV